MNDIEEKIIEEFIALKPELKKWGAIVDKEIMSILEKEVDIHSMVKIEPSYRLKDDTSFLYKVLYRNKTYSNPIVDIEDKVGTRIVLLKSIDIEIVANIILKHTKWNAKVTKSIKEILDKFPAIFDYQSTHIVVWPKDEYCEGNKDLAEKLTCEIQIRTLLQHAFAEVSHDSTYKGPFKNDNEIIRHLAKSMALMESTDDYFCNIFNMMSDEKRYFANYVSELIVLFKKYNDKFTKNDLDFEINDSLLDLAVKKNVQIAELGAFVEKYDDDLRKAILEKNGIFFKQPISILVAYLLYNHQTFLKEKWPFNLESLKIIYKAFGKAFEAY